MPLRIESDGDIETLCKVEPARPGEAMELVFRAHDDAAPPFTCRVTAPGGAVIFERVLRDLPTNMPQSAPPVRFVTSVSGDYKLEIWELYGSQRGTATLHVS